MNKKKDNNNRQQNHLDFDFGVQHLQAIKKYLSGIYHNIVKHCHCFSSYHIVIEFSRLKLQMCFRIIDILYIMPFTFTFIHLKDIQPQNSIHYWKF